MKRNLGFGWLVLASLVLAVLACGKSQATPTAEGLIGEPPVVAPAAATSTPIVHLVQPVDPPTTWESEINDRDSSTFAEEHRASGGENYTINLFERPFEAGDLGAYHPELDILQARLGRDSQWVYITIGLQDLALTGGLGGTYGAEFDLDVDGRGDTLVLAAVPGSDWSTDGVGVWEDSNGDNGALRPMLTDAPAVGDGYETQVFSAGVGADPDLAWARLSPLDPKSVQVAIKREYIDDDYFMWGAWVDRGVFTPGFYDYSDHFTLDEAGSPLLEQEEFYPLKALFELDNTCRWSVGFTPIGNEPGLCGIDCTQYKTQPSCVAHPVCAWQTMPGIAALASGECVNK